MFQTLMVILPLFFQLCNFTLVFLNEHSVYPPV
jgi:hypothetical protein